MPGSIRENDEDVQQFALANRIERVLDVGPGKGTYSRLLRKLVQRIEAVEIWMPYVERFDLLSQYDLVHIADIRDWGGWEEYDLVVFGDVLEHMTAESAQEVWAKAGAHSRYTLMSVPVIHYPQGESHGNPYEAHVQEHLQPEAIRRDYGPFILDKVYRKTGTFIREWP